MDLNRAHPSLRDDVTDRDHAPRSNHSYAVPPFIPAGLCRISSYRELETALPVLLRERLHHLDTLSLLGFSHSVSISILRYWITLKLGAPAGGPYELIGVALAIIAELSETESATATLREESCRLGWCFVFARVLNCEAMEVLYRAGVFRASSFATAKLMAYRIIMRRWEELVGSKMMVWS